MALAFTEKRALQKELKKHFVDLKSGSLKFAAKRALQKEVKKINEQLGVKPSPADDAYLPEDLNSRDPVEFRELLIKADAKGAPLELLVNATTNYMENNIELVAGI